MPEELEKVKKVCWEKAMSLIATENPEAWLLMFPANPGGNVEGANTPEQKAKVSEEKKQGNYDAALPVPGDGVYKSKSYPSPGETIRSNTYKGEVNGGELLFPVYGPYSV